MTNTSISHLAQSTMQQDMSKWVWKHQIYWMATAVFIMSFRSGSLENVPFLKLNRVGGWSHKTEKENIEFCSLMKEKTVLWNVIFRYF